MELKSFVPGERKRLGLSQQELADRVGVSRQTIVSIEKGRTIPSLLLAFKITQALGRNFVEEIFSYENNSD